MIAPTATALRGWTQVALTLAALTAGPAAAELHPAVPLLDADGQPAARSGKPVSALKSCDGCHDSQYVATHGDHFTVGAGEPAPAGAPAWDSGPGLLGRFDPLTYDRFTPPEAAAQDLDLAGWIRRTPRHAGGGPAADLVEANCFLCHLQAPDDAGRRVALAAGAFAWATTATLGRVKVGDQPLVIRSGTDAHPGYTLNAAALDEDGAVPSGALGLAGPGAAQCGQCHGMTPAFRAPVTWAPATTGPLTALTGQVFSAQRLRQSELNLRGKAELGRPWDVHAERMVDCVDCHPAANNPATFREVSGTRPGHLRGDARAPSLKAFLQRPDHRLQKGSSAQFATSDALDGGQRGCQDCHEPGGSHPWLPYADRHFQQLQCEACHVPAMHAPARESTDWTVLTTTGEPRVVWRGLTGAPSDAHRIIEPTRPVLLPRTDADGQTRLGPHNLHTTWLWTKAAGTGRAPVTRTELEAAWLDHGTHPPALVKALDRDGDGALAEAELVLDTPARVATVATRLRGAGVVDPRIEGQIQPVGLHHGVGTRGTAVKDCLACHGPESRLSAPMILAGVAPADVTPKWRADSRTAPMGQVVRDGGGWVLRPDATEAGVYAMGHHRLGLAEAFGLLALLGVVLGVSVHGGLRVRLALKRRKQA